MVFIYSWFGINIVLLLLPVVTVHSSDSAAQCETLITPLEGYEVHKDRGGLNAMCKAAEGMRYDIIKDGFPYDFAAQQAKLW